MKFVLFLLASSMLPAAAVPQKGTPPHHKEVVAAQPQPNYDARRIPYHFGQAAPVYAQLRWNTVLILPANEKILDYICGDKDNWEIHGPRNTNFAIIDPTKAGAKTDLTLITASGNVYSFVLEDVSKQPDTHADTQVIVDVVDNAMKQAMDGKPKFVAADAVDAFRAEAQKAQEQAKQQEASDQARLDAELAKLRADLPATIHADYRCDCAPDKGPFNIESIYRDDKFTYVRSKAEEAFAVYEVRDGKSVAVNIYPNGDGLYRLDRVVDRGYFQIGKKKLDFALESE